MARPERDIIAQRHLGLPPCSSPVTIGTGDYQLVSHKKAPDQLARSEWWLHASESPYVISRPLYSRRSSSSGPRCLSRLNARRTHRVSPPPCSSLPGPVDTWSQLAFMGFQNSILRRV